jgi:WD40 repeat protein
MTTEGTHVLLADGNEVRKVEVSSGKDVRARPHRGRLHAALLTPDGKQVATVGADKLLRMTRVEDGQETLSLETKYEYGMDGIWMSPEGTWIGTAGWGRVTLWNLKDRTKIVRFDAERQKATALRFTAEGTVVTANDAGKVRVYHLERGAIEREMYTSPGAHAFSPDGRSVAATGDEHVRSIILWNLNSGEQVLKIRDEDPRAIAFSPDGKRILYGKSNGEVRSIDLAAREITTTVQVEGRGIQSLAVDPTGRFLAVANGEDVVLLAQDTLREAARLPVPDASEVSFHTDGRTLLVRGGVTATILKIEEAQ